MAKKLVVKIEKIPSENYGDYRAHWLFQRSDIKGCPLGSGDTVELAIADLLIRTNHESNLNLVRGDVEIDERFFPVEKPEFFERKNFQTGEAVVGTWDEVCDLDVRIWSRAKKASRQNLKPVVATVKSVCVRKDSGPVMVMAGIPVDDVHHFMTRKAAIKRLQKMNVAE